MCNSKLLSLWRLVRLKVWAGNWTLSRNSWIKIGRKGSTGRGKVWGFLFWRKKNKNAHAKDQRLSASCGLLLLQTVKFFTVGGNKWGETDCYKHLQVLKRQNGSVIKIKEEIFPTNVAIWSQVRRAPCPRCPTLLFLMLHLLLLLLLSFCFYH